MNKSVLRNFAVNARQELMERIKQKAFEIGISEDKVKKAQIEASDAIYINGQALDSMQIKQRNSLIEELQMKGYNRVIEEVAYTWFNRFSALRFMEVNDYLPAGVRVLSSSLPGSMEPDILREALYVDLDIDREKVFELREADDSNGLFKYLIIQQCHQLNQCFPFLFEKIADYSEILFPDNLLQEGSFLRIIADTDNIPREDWQNVEIIGWLYQYYISEKKEEVFAGLKKNIKITKENIPAATQLFTPHWIVRYLLENSLGRLWMLNHPESRLIDKMDYYIKPEQNDGDFLRISSPEEIKICDPACGSGHMLLYAFDLLYAIYEEEGYILREIPGLILENNLFGMEIDKRAAELAAFALVMKARRKNRRFFRNPIQPHICVLENVKFDDEELRIYKEEIGEDLFTANLFPALWQFEEADNFGSLIRPGLNNVSDIRQLLEAKNPGDNLFLNKSHLKVLQALKQADYLSQKYHVVIANPPYMGGKGMNPRLKDFAKENYPDSKSDLFAMFIERGFDLAINRGLIGMITMQSWMFLSSFEKLRDSILNKKTILSMAHLGARAFDSIGGEVVSTTAFVIENINRPEYKGAYLRLVDENCEADKEAELKAKRSAPYRASAADFKGIPGLLIAYWLSNKLKQIFHLGREISKDSYPRKGLTTGNNDSFIRLWYEVEKSKLSICSGLKWYPMTKGGNYRKWFGNNDYIINWEDKGMELKAFHGSVIRNEQFYLQEGGSWNDVSTTNFSIRYIPNGFINNAVGPVLYSRNIIELIALLNSSVSRIIFNVLSPTMKFEIGAVASFPFITPKSLSVTQIKRLIDISKLDWDSYETSWDFTILPLLNPEYRQSSLQETYNCLRRHWRDMTLEMQRLEEENNRIFIEAYGLQEELTPDVPLNEITLTCNPCYRYGGDRSEEELEALLLLDTIKEYISYAVGCMLGRYSPDREGLAFAGGEFDPSLYPTFPADRDNVIPVLADDYFKDDIVTRLVDFVRLTLGREKLEENLEFIADTLGRRASETARDSIRRYFLNDFYKDHVKSYKKRPIYWMFTSGREKAFNCLIYLHRYQADTIASIRTEYLHRQQEALEVEKQQLQRLINEETGSKSARNAAKSMLKLDKKILELKKYEEVIHHYADMRINIDLDDGVKVNYAKFREVLAKI
jgi:type II restriction/modification system DNA methylase subunit YeeA